MSDTANADGYVLSRTAGENERSRAQAAIWAPLTDRALAQAGLGAGMHARDAGCGPCEAMRLMARRTGPGGSVTGVDIDGDVGAFGPERLRPEEDGAFHFHTADAGRDPRHRVKGRALPSLAEGHRGMDTGRRPRRRPRHPATVSKKGKHA